jgi:hypothetical protein
MSGNLKSPDIRELKPRIAVVGVGGAAGRRIRAGTLAPTPGKELEPACLSCAARTELNTIAERTNIFAGLPFGLVKNDPTSLYAINRGKADDLLKARRAGALVQSGLVGSQLDGRRQSLEGFTGLKTLRICQEYLE